MKHVLLAASLAFFALTATPVTAQTMQDALVAQLSEQGFTRIKIARTFLGRVRILATSADYSREIIFNPRTGEILRDYWDDLDDGEGGFQGRIAVPGSGSSSGLGGDDDRKGGSGAGSGSGSGSGSGAGKGRDDDKNDDKGDDKNDEKDDHKDDHKNDDGDDD